MKQKIKSGFIHFGILLKSVPALTFSLFVLSVFAMNLLANKSINMPQQLNWLALDCGIIVSWVAFLSMDMLTKHFGPKAATQLSLLALAINLFACLLMFAVSKIGGTWGAFFDFGEADVVNDALDATFGGTWYVVLGSALAFAASAAVNNFSNWGIGKLFRNPDGFGAYICRTYASTAIGQFVDNLIFALVVSHSFFGWSLLQCFTCAATGMLAELLCEAVFAPIGYRVCKRWRTAGVGQAYFDYQPNGGAQ